MFTETKENPVLNYLPDRNKNDLILGRAGSGKSTLAKHEIKSLLSKDPNAKVYILDFESEYASMATTLQSMGINANVVRIAPDSETHINPFDINISDNNNDSIVNAIAEKSDFICALCQSIMGKKHRLSSIGKSIIHRCIYNIYSNCFNCANTTDKDISVNTELLPTMFDFYSLLIEQPEPEAQYIALSIEKFCFDGFFAHKTNVDTNARVIIYDIRGIGFCMEETASLICLNHAWNEMIHNFKKGIRTLVYIDQLYPFTKSESSSAFLAKMWRRSRMQNGVLCGIAQSTKNLVKTESTRAIINNCEFVIMLSQSPIDEIILRDLYCLSDEQLKHIANQSLGHGLIYDEGEINPFEFNLFKTA